MAAAGSGPGPGGGPGAATLSGGSLYPEPASDWQEALLAELKSSRAGTREQEADVCQEALADLRATTAPEATAGWCQAWEVYRAYEHDIWPERTGSGDELFTSLHVGESAAASVFALNHFLASSARLQPPGLKWQWRAADENPHFEARAASRAWTEAENMLYCNYPEHWFHTEDDSGCLVSGSAWRGQRLWEWLRGPSASPGELARRLPRLVMASPLRAMGRAGEATDLLLATLITALGALRVGGCLCQALRDPLGSPEAEAFLALLALLFERVDAAPRGWPAPGTCDICIVALRFRGIRGPLLQALASAVRRTLAGKQSWVLSADWARRALGGPPMVARLAQWLSTWGARPAGADAREGAQRYVRDWGLRPLPEQRHLLWSCWPDLLGKGPGRQPLAASRPSESAELGAALARAQLLQSRRQERWLARKRARPPSGPELREPASKRARLAPQPSASSVPRAQRSGEELKSPRWFALDTGNLAHRGLLRSLQSADVALQTAQSLWWRPCGALPPWQFLHSAFAPMQKLLALIEAKSEAEAGPGLDDSPWGLLGGYADIPPLLVATWVHLLVSFMPWRLGEGNDTLSYQRTIHLHGPGRGRELEPATAGPSLFASWLRERMRLRAESACVSASLLASGAEAGASGAVEEGFDAVLIDFAASAFSDEGCSEVAAAELDAEARKGLVTLLLVGLRAVAPGGDLFLRLPSLYTRLLAGLCALLAVAFERIAVVLPKLTPARGERWVLCNGFCSADRRGSAARELLGAFRTRLLAAPAGTCIPQVLPPSCTCSVTFGLRQWLCDVNEEAIDAELRRYADASAGRPPEQGPRHEDAEKRPALRQLTELGLKPILYPGPEHRTLVAAYFGTFDPFHENHFRVVQCALRDCGVRRVVLVPNQTGNPYKPLCGTLALRIRCIEARVAEAERQGELQQGQVVVRAAGGATNWPQREELARALEREEFAETATSAEVALLLGEDSLLKSLESGAGKHKNSGIFQLKTRPRQIIVFPREGTGESILSKVPERLRPFVKAAPHEDLVKGLSSSGLRQLLESGSGEPPPAESVHPSVWRLLTQGERELPAPAPPHGLRAPADPEDTVQDTRLHYDAKAPQSMEQRQASATVRLRNFNSFAKAVLFEQIFTELRREVGSSDAPLSVLDLGCGQGGDLKKMANCGVTDYCGVDFSEASLCTLLTRVKALCKDVGRARHGLLGETGLPMRGVSLLRADCWRTRLAPALDSSARHGTARLDGLRQAWFHLVSSQMACHYAFQSKDAAETMLRNASERLCEGGLFAGTLPDAARIVSALEEAWEKTGELQAGNGLYKVEFDAAEWAKVQANLHHWRRPTAGSAGQDLFGVMYKFSLVDAVDRCCEPLVHFGTLRDMARRHGLELHMGPVPLTELVSRALAEGDAKAQLGRLCRIYHYHGGMRCDEASPEWSALRLYSAFVFRKERAESGTPMTCEQLSSSLRRLHTQQGPGLRLPDAAVAADAAPP